MRQLLKHLEGYREKHFYCLPVLSELEEEEKLDWFEQTYPDNEIKMEEIAKYYLNLGYEIRTYFVCSIKNKDKDLINKEELKKLGDVFVSKCCWW